jgi:hypothetical protein
VIAFEQVVMVHADAIILMLGRTTGLFPSFRQGTPESSHRDVNLNRPTDPNQASITPMAT